MQTYEEILGQIQVLQEQAEQVRQQEIQKVLADIREKIQKYDLSAEELGFSAARSSSGRSRSSRPRVVRYRKGDLTWAGRGRKPKWIEELEAAGADIERYRVA